jgi:guanosine-3',5'-bis(diphosphate) 3'-pyrophosphohydrolase
VKLADKICNLRDVADRPPRNGSSKRRQEYFEWAKQVIDGLRGIHPGLEAAFDAAYRLSRSSEQGNQVPRSPS